ncbi:MAG: hypothetical protein ABIG95_02850 [Candidatus Woesearchaeota archaeon]
MNKPKPKKSRIWLRIDQDILKWVYKNIEEKVYANESHAFESLVMEKIKREEDEAK